MKEYDVVVIGAGPGGYVAAIRAAQLGLSVACIEKEKAGGTCLNVGCIPSKALLQSTEIYASFLHEANVHGVTYENLKADLDVMMKRKKGIVEGLVQGVEHALKSKHVDFIVGFANLVDPHKIEVVRGEEKEEFTAKNIILATGSEPVSLPFLPFDEKRILSSTGALSLSEIPKKMIVIGAGVIGVELASVYSRLGTEVVIIEALDQICGGLDDTLSRTFLTVLKKQNLTFHLGAKVLSGQANNDGVTLNVILKGMEEKETMQADVVLVAVGRRPFSEGLKNIGLDFTIRGFLPVNNRFQTKIPHIYAIGDLIEGPMLAHRASLEGAAVAELIAQKETSVNYLAIPNVIYTHPELASVGLTEAQAKAFNLEILIGTCSFKANPRARCMGETDGLVKVIADKKSGRLIGMHILGPNASEIIAEGVVAIQNNLTLESLVRTPHAHPTLSEAILEAAENALGKSIHL